MHYLIKLVEVKIIMIHNEQNKNILVHFLSILSKELNLKCRKQSL